MAIFSTCWPFWLLNPLFTSRTTDKSLSFDFDLTAHLLTEQSLSMIAQEIGPHEKPFEIERKKRFSITVFLRSWGKFNEVMARRRTKSCAVTLNIRSQLSQKTCIVAIKNMSERFKKLHVSMTTVYEGDKDP